MFKPAICFLLFALPVLASELPAHSETCWVHVGVLQSETLEDEHHNLYSVHQAKVLGGDACGEVKGAVIYFAAPGGEHHGRAQVVAGLWQPEAGDEAYVGLSAQHSGVGARMMLRAEPAFGLPSLQKQAYACTRASNNGPSLFWPKRTIEMRPGYSNDPDVTPALLQSAMEIAASAWNSPECSDMHITIGPPATQRWIGYDWAKGADNQNIVTVRKPTSGDFYSAWLEESSTVALTTYTYIQSTGEIVDADIEFNAHAHAFADCEFDPDDCFEKYDLANTMTHEFGHVLSLGHPEGEGYRAWQATMYGTTYHNQISKRVLSEDDIAGLCFLYPKGLPPRECFGVDRKSPPSFAVSNANSLSCQTLGHNMSEPLILLMLAAVVLFYLRRLGAR